MRSRDRSSRATAACCAAARARRRAARARRREVPRARRLAGAGGATGSRTQPRQIKLIRARGSFRAPVMANRSDTNTCAWGVNGDVSVLARYDGHGRDTQCSPTRARAAERCDRYPLRTRRSNTHQSSKTISRPDAPFGGVRHTFGSTSLGRARRCARLAVLRPRTEGRAKRARQERERDAGSGIIALPAAESRVLARCFTGPQNRGSFC